MAAQNSIVTPARDSNPRANHQPKKLYPLDEKLIRLYRKGDWLRLRDFVRNIGVSGSIGSGKTSGPIHTFQRTAWAAGHCGLILCAKPDSAAQAIELAKHAGRGDDIVHVRFGSGYSVNPIKVMMTMAEEMGFGIPLDEALDEVWTMVEILNRGDVAQQGDNFFVPAQKELIHKVMKVLWASTRDIDMREMVECCRFVPDDLAAWNSPGRYPILRHLEAIRRRGGWNQDIADLDSYFQQLAILSEKTRSSIQISATVRLAPMLEEPIYSLCFKRPTNITPKEIRERGLLVVLDYPYAQYRGSARALGAMFKGLCQKLCMNQPDHDEQRPFGIWADEAACWLTQMDIEATERGRSARMYHCLSWQADSTLVNGYGGGAMGESRAAALRSNLIVQVICAQVDYPTRKNRMDGAGQTKQWVQQVTPVPEQAEPRVSLSQQYLPAFPEEWMLGLECGAKGYVEAFVFTGEKFKYNGQRRMLARWYRPLGDGWRWWSPFIERQATARSWACSVSWRDFWNLWNRTGFRQAVAAWLDFRITTMVYPDFHRSRRGRHE